jgi:hypothetical protein
MKAIASRAKTNSTINPSAIQTTSDIRYLRCGVAAKSTAAARSEARAEREETRAEREKTRAERGFAMGRTRVSQSGNCTFEPAEPA